MNELLSSPKSGEGEIPLMKLSWVRRQQKKASVFLILLLGLWIACLIAVILLIRPLMETNDWYGFLIILYLFPSCAAMFYGWSLVLRCFGLRCPHCGATFIHMEIKDQRKTLEEIEEEDRCCGGCKTVMIDLTA